MEILVVEKTPWGTASMHDYFARHLVQVNMQICNWLCYLRLKRSRAMHKIAAAIKHSWRMLSVWLHNDSDAIEQAQIVDCRLKQTKRFRNCYWSLTQDGQIFNKQSGIAYTVHVICEGACD